MEDTLENDGKGSSEKLKGIVDDLEAIHNKKKYEDVTFSELTLNLLSNFVKLRQENWGRLSRPSSVSSSTPVPPEQDENYFMVS